MAKRKVHKTKNILCYVDLSKSSAYLIEYAKQLSDKIGASLYFLHSVTDINKFAGFYVPHMNTSSLSDQMLQAAKDKLFAMCRQTIGEVEPSHRIIREGDPLDAIYDEIEKHKIDLLIIGHEYNVFSLFKTDYVIRYLKDPPCPVIVYPLSGE